jgi:polysaccharide biosynthesis/export protein
MTRTPGNRKLIALATLLAACSCVGLAQVPRPTTQDDTRQQETPKPVVVSPQSQGGGAPVDSSTYKVGPSDVLNINVWHEQEFTGLYTVHSDGKITMKLVGDLQAGGKTPREIQEEVKQALSKYVVNPLVTITVQDVLSKKYYMDGQINRPGEYALASPTTILEAISKGGGLREFANEKHIYVLRGEKRITFNYKDVIRGKHLEQNIQLQPDDHIVVP